MGFEPIQRVRRHPVLFAVWAALCLLLVVQHVRLGRFMFDPSADWWLTTRHELWAKHSCLPAYVEAADLQRQGAANVYDARYYGVLDRSAKPPLTVKHLDAFAGDPFQYPPPFLLLPRAAMAISNDFLVLRSWWYVLELAAFVATSLLVAAWVGGRSGSAAALLVALLGLSVPLLQSLQYGQFHLAALLLAVAGMVAVEQGSHAVGGALLAVSILSKIFPGVLVVLLVFQRRWRAIAWTIGAGAALVLLALLVLGPRPFEAFVGYQLPRLADGRAFDFTREWPELRTALLADNLAPAAVVAKLHELGVPGMTRRVGTLAAALSALSLLALTIAVGLRKAASDRAVKVTTWLALLNLAALQSGGAWGDYITLGSAWLLTYLVEDFRRSRRAATALAVAGVACLAVPGVQPIPTFLPVPVAMILTTGVFVVVVSLNVWVLLRRKSTGVLP